MSVKSGHLRREKSGDGEKVKIFFRNSSMSRHLWREKSDDGGRVGDEAEDAEGREENALAPKLKLLPYLFKLFWNPRSLWVPPV